MLSLKPFLRSKHGTIFAMAFLLIALLLTAAACDNVAGTGSRGGTVLCVCCDNLTNGENIPCTCGCEPFVDDEQPPGGDDGPGVEPFKLGYEMALIPAGTFTMGSPANEPDRQPYNTDETQHQVTLTKAFYMGAHEVTQTQYEKVMGEGSDYSFFSTINGYPYKPGEVEGSRPVEYITWHQVIVFCNTLSIKEGLTPAYSMDGKTDPAEWGRLPRKPDEKWDSIVWNREANGYRLPTEAEWEYACRAGTTTAYSSGAEVTSLEGTANIADNTLRIEDPDLVEIVGYVNITDNYGIPAPVKSYAPNDYGLYDMHGNVVEWCWDWYGTYPRSAQTDPTGPAKGTLRAARGGNYYSRAENLRSAGRGYRQAPLQTHTGIGFRLARFQ